MHLGNKRAFTLAELLTAVLVISVIMVALAPVITKRMKESISVQTDNKKGLEIYTNPGTYTFDVPIGINTLFIQGSGGAGGGAGSTYVEKDVSFTSSTTWTGGSNGASTPSVNEKNSRVYNNKCLSDEFLAVRGSTNETDLCYTKRNLSYPDTIGAQTVEMDPNLNQGQTCTRTGVCCWNGDANSCSAPASGGAATGCNRAVCTLEAASQVCGAYKSKTREERGTYRLPANSELKKIAKYFNEWSVDAGSNGLQICSHNDNYGCDSQIENAKMPICKIRIGCNGAYQNYCVESYIWASDGTSFGRHGVCRNYLGNSR